MANPFAYVELHTKDATQAKDFYRKLFDWSTSDSETPMGPYTMIDAKDGIPAGLMKDERSPVPHWLPYVKVDDVSASVRKVKDLGGRVLMDVMQIPEGTYAVIADPGGAALGLWQSSKKG